MTLRVAVAVGTRPEAIKMAPVILALQAEREIETIVVSSGQHRDMLAQALDIFGIVPDHDLAVMREGQTPSDVTAAVIAAFDALLERVKPGWVLVHGDTTTAMAASIAAFHRGIAIGHVEAGLRTGDLSRPFPEEFNRRCVDLLAQLLWAPTERARENLLLESLSQGKRILVTGNTVIDALKWAADRLDNDTDLRARIDAKLPALDKARRMILVTGHRRESFGEGFKNICEALAALASRGDVEIVYPVHLNPNVAGPVRSILGKAKNVHLIAPQDYLAFVRLMQRAYLILTDSGGVQEEGPSLGKPVLVMREVTERPEAIEAGSVRLVGTARDPIADEAARLLDDASAYARMANAVSPYGDGHASGRIVRSLLESPVSRGA